MLMAKREPKMYGTARMTWRCTTQANTSVACLCLKIITPKCIVTSMHFITAKIKDNDSVVKFSNNYNTINE